MKRAALLLAMVPSLALGQAAPWLQGRCTEKLKKRPEIVDVPPTNDQPQGGWLLPDPLVCAIDRDLRKKQVVIYRDRQVETFQAAPVIVGVVLGLAGGVVLTLAVQGKFK